MNLLPLIKLINLQTPLEGIDEQDEALAVLDGEPGVVQVVDDLLPVQRRLQLVHHLDEQLHVPRLRLGGLAGKMVMIWMASVTGVTPIPRPVCKGPI